MDALFHLLSLHFPFLLPQAPSSRLSPGTPGSPQPIEGSAPFAGVPFPGLPSHRLCSGSWWPRETPLATGLLPLLGPPSCGHSLGTVVIPAQCPKGTGGLRASCRKLCCQQQPRHLGAPPSFTLKPPSPSFLSPCCPFP